MIVTVTGARGFVGSSIVPVLSAAGHSVRPLEHLGEFGVANRNEERAVDVATGKGLDKAFEGTDAVIHLAARNLRKEKTSGGRASDYRRVNVDGTRNVARAARAAGVRLLIYASSVKAMGEGSESILGEERPCVPRTPYGATKLESEHVLSEEAAGSQMKTVILRLAPVYGTGCGGNFLRLLCWAGCGRAAPIVKPERLRSVLYVRNLCSAVLALMDASTIPSSATYLLKDDEDVSIRGVFAAFCGALDRKPRFVDIPEGLARLGSVLSRSVRDAMGAMRVSSAKFRNDIGFVPPYSLEDGASEMVKWYRRSVG